MRTAWGVFKAIRMSGIDDRDDFYQFWYQAVDLQSGEVPLESWKAMRVPITLAQNLSVVGGNLILTTQRLIFEPGSNQRAAFGRRGSKFVINTLAAMQDRVSPRAPLAVPLQGLRVEPRSGAKHALAVSGSDGVTVELYFGLTTVGRGDAGRRDEVLARLLAAT